MPTREVPGTVSVITCDMSGTVQQYAADAEELFGWPRDRVVGRMSVAAFHLPENVPTLVPRLLREAVEKGHFEEQVTLQRRDGSTFPALLTVRPMYRDGQQVGFMGFTKPLGPPTSAPVARLWFQALRAPFLVASLVPALVAALLAWQVHGAFDLPLFLIAFAGLASIHIGANMSNDAYDFRSGNDLEVRHLNPFAGGSRVLIRGVLGVRTHLAVALLFLTAGSLAGLYLALQVGWPLLAIGMVGVGIAYSYVGPPLRLAHHGIGEIAVGVDFGLVTVLGMYFLLARTIDAPAVLVATVMGLLVIGILWINEVPDIPADSAVGKRTLVVRLGVSGSTKAFAGIVLGAYALLVAGVGLGILTPWALLGLLALPLALRPIRGLIKVGGDPHALIPSNAGMILATLATGLLLLAGLVLGSLVHL